MFSNDSSNSNGNFSSNANSNNVRLTQAYMGIGMIKNACIDLELGIADYIKRLDHIREEAIDDEELHNRRVNSVIENIYALQKEYEDIREAFGYAIHVTKSDK